MNPEFILLLVLFSSLLLLGVPVAFTLALTTLGVGLYLNYDNVSIRLASDIGNGLDSFALLAIPFFILAGEIMGTGGLARRLIAFAASIVGRLPGGLALVNGLTCMLFGSISGSATAAVSSIGGTLIPEMRHQGYPRDFAIALTTTAATTGLLIPPSNIMIVYALVAANVSIAALFLAGILPGILMGTGLMTVAFILSRRHGYGATPSADIPPLGRAFLRALPSLLLIVVVLGGILGGIFTATEASAIAVLWAFLLSFVFYREIPFHKLGQILIKAARTTAVVLFLVATSYTLSRLLTEEQAPQTLSAILLSLSENPLIILLIINLILLMAGTVMDMTPAVLIFTPILLPVAIELGIDPVHFGILMIANLCIGLCTPPVGTCLFVGAGVGLSNIIAVSRSMIPYYFIMVAVLLIITYWPALSLTLPSLLK